MIWTHHNLWTIYETDKAVKFIDKFMYSALSKIGKKLQKWETISYAQQWTAVNNAFWPLLTRAG